MDRQEQKLRERLARAKGGHARVLQGRLDAYVTKGGTVEEAVAPPAPKKKATRKKKAE